MKSSASAGGSASRAWPYSSLPIDFVWKVIAARDLPAQSFQHIVAGVEDSVISDGSKNFSGTCVEPS